MKNQEIKNKIAGLKQRYDKSRTTFEVSKANREQCIKDMKEYGVTPDNIDEAINNLKADIEKKEKSINKSLSKIDEKLKKIK